VHKIPLRMALKQLEIVRKQNEEIIEKLRQPQFYGHCASLQKSVTGEVILSGPAGTGKSLAALYKLYACAMRYPGFRGAIIRKTRTSLTETGLVTFERDVLGLDHKLLVNGPSRAYRSRYTFDNGSEIVIAGLDRPSRILSSEYDIIFVQQAEEIALREWEILTTRLRNYQMPYQQLIGDCNPESPMHWIKQRGESNALVLWETTHQDNPLLWDARTNDWTEEGRRYLATLDKLTGATKRRLRYGEWVHPEGAIYETFDEDRHVVKSFDVPLTWPRFVGIDPFGAYIAAVWLAFDVENGVLNAYREYYEPFGITTQQHVKNILDITRRYGETVFAWVGGGPSERQARTDFAGAGIPLMEPPISDVWSGIDRVNELLRENTLVVHEGTCPNLTSELGSYRRKMDKNGQPTDQIENKETYHMLDALRYIVVYLTQSPDLNRREVVYKSMQLGRY